ncbi:MAG: hypothetical protein Q9160_007087 [Pyrenula sp. 1 TL-2023]
MTAEMPLPGKAPEPTKKWFDPWNSASTGHQTAQNILSGSTSWRQSRSYKLSHQLGDTSGEGGRYHRADLVGAGSENFGKDGRKANGSWEKGAVGLRERGCQDIRESLGAVKKQASNSAGAEVQAKKRPRALIEPLEREGFVARRQKTEPTLEVTLGSKDTANSTGGQTLSSEVLTGVTVYINGSTAPLVGDHKLKQLIARHGGHVAIALGRKTVTHVILSESGGLAAGKLQKEIEKTRGKDIRFVTAGW